MKIILEVDNLDNAVVTGTLWELLDDLKTSEQIKDYKIVVKEENVFRLYFKSLSGQTWCRPVPNKELLHKLALEEACSDAIKVDVEYKDEIIFSHVFTEEERRELKAR